MSQSKQGSLAPATDPVDFGRDQTVNSHFSEDDDDFDAALEAMGEDDGDFETWLRTVGGPAYDRMVADPSIGIPAEEVLRAIEERSHAISKQSA